MVRIFNIFALMIKRILYVLILTCVSLIGAQGFDIMSDSEIQTSESLQENLCLSECKITEQTHEQCATRPTNVQVPSITRTSTAHRSQNSNSHTSSAYKADINAHNYTCALNYSDSRSLISGFTDSSTYFKSLCRLLI